MEPAEALTCPKCRARMESVTFKNVEVDRCTNCQGLWLDAWEKEQLKAAAGSEVIDTGSAEVGKSYNTVDKIDCPRCHTSMVRMVDAKQYHIWYESCPVCYGTFFDAGEFTDYKEETLGDFFKTFFAKERK